MTRRCHFLGGSATRLPYPDLELPELLPSVAVFHLPFGCSSEFLESIYLKGYKRGSRGSDRYSTACSSYAKIPTTLDS